MGAETFAAEGVVRLAGVMARGDVAAMRGEVERMLEGMALEEIAGALRPGPEAGEALWRVGKGRAFEGLAKTVGTAVDGIFGSGIWEPVEAERGGLAAPNLPVAGAGSWTVPHSAWHVDEPTAAGQERSWGLLAFALLDDVERGGGATVAITGSQRRLLRLAGEIAPVGLLTTELAMAVLSDREPWFAALFAAGGDAEERRRFFMDREYVSDSIPLRVVELTGAAGDVVLMDPRCLHTVSANRSGRARLQMRLTCSRIG